MTTAWPTAGVASSTVAWNVSTTSLTSVSADLRSNVKVGLAGLTILVKVVGPTVLGPASSVIEVLLGAMVNRGSGPAESKVTSVSVVNSSPEGNVTVIVSPIAGVVLLNTMSWTLAGLLSVSAAVTGNT